MLKIFILLSFKLIESIVGKPTTPFGIKNASLTNTSVTVVWNPPKAEFPIKNYKSVIKTKQEGTVIQTKQELNTTSASFFGLSAFTEYLVEVSAQSTVNVFSNPGYMLFRTDEGG